MFSSISHHISLKLNCSLNWILNRTQTHSLARSFALSLTHTIQMLNIDWPKVRTQICDIWWHCDDAIVHHLHLNMKTACLYSYLWSIVKTIVVLKCGMLEKWMNERFNEWADGWNRSVSASVSGKCRVCVCGGIKGEQEFLEVNKNTLTMCTISHSDKNKQINNYTKITQNTLMRRSILGWSWLKCLKCFILMRVSLTSELWDIEIGFSYTYIIIITAVRTIWCIC